MPGRGARRRVQPLVPLAVLLAFACDGPGTSPPDDAAPGSARDGGFFLGRSIDSRAPDARVLEIEGVEVLPGPSAAPPADDDPRWAARTLPDFLSRRRLGRTNEVWYRARFALPAAPEELWALYLPRLRMNAEAFVDRVRIGDGGRFGPNPARNWNRPLYFTVPASLLGAGEHTLHLRLVTTAASDIRLLAAQLGPDAVLRPAFDARMLRQVVLRRDLVVLTLATGVLLGFVALRRPELRGAPYFAGVLGCIGLGYSDGIVQDLPVPAMAWQWINTMIYLLSFVLTTLGVDRALGGTPGRKDVALWSLLGVLGVVVAVAPYYFITVTAGLLALGFLTLGYAAWRIAAAMRAGTFRRGRVLLVSALVLAGITLHDLQSGITGRALPYAPLSSFIPLVIAACAAWIIIGYVLGKLAESEALAEQLDQRVAASVAELQQNYDRLREMEWRQAAADERERILRDMHDGLGGHVVSALSMVKRGVHDSEQVAEVLQEALDEMRLLLDSVAISEDLSQVLGSLRARVEPRLERHGLRFDWRVSELPDLPGLGPRGVVQVIRIVQECLSNVIKHADATTVRISTGLATGSGREPGVFLEVEDDGRGIPEPCRRDDRGGLANMRWRAAQLRGEVEIIGGRGTRIRLWLPIAHAPADAPPDDERPGRGGRQASALGVEPAAPPARRSPK